LWWAQGRAADAVRLVESACARLSQGRDLEDFAAAQHLLDAARVASRVVPPCVERQGDVDLRLNPHLNPHLSPRLPKRTRQKVSEGR
jgi:hypothetical protein